MDEKQFENAARLTDLQRDNEIARIRANAQTRELHPTGYCYFCSDDLPLGVLFCPPDEFGCCKTSYERQQRTRSYNGHG